ncbi:MAG: hypothetical protein Q8O56_12305 [Solirubrobacteraceae bacterium]|nr:hypothetical protein [Solirubrobacteraceae bacterium]
MIAVRKSHLIGVAAAVAALAAPAAALAHPSVYVTSAPTACGSPAAPFTVAQYLATCTTQTRYVFTNHGNTFLLRESNGKTTGGAISYPHRPGGETGLAAASDFDLFSTTLGPTTGAQIHATCDVPALTSPAAVRSWQEGDPFYAYVPFQRGPAGVDDDGSAAAWRSTVLGATGVDLDAVADSDEARAAACAALPGATASSYVPADETQATIASWSSGPVGRAAAPLHATIAAQQGQLAAQHARIGSLGAAGDNAAAQVSALTAQIQELNAALRRLELSLPATIPSPSGAARNGIALGLSGPPGRRVGVRALIGAAQAKRLGLRSRIVATSAVTLDGTGNRAFTLRPASSAARGLRKASTAVVLIQATSGDRATSASATLGG